MAKIYSVISDIEFLSVSIHLCLYVRYFASSDLAFLLFNYAYQRWRLLQFLDIALRFLNFSFVNLIVYHSVKFDSVVTHMKLTATLSHRINHWSILADNSFFKCSRYLLWLDSFVSCLVCYVRLRVIVVVGDHFIIRGLVKEIIASICRLQTRGCQSLLSEFLQILNLGGTSLWKFLTSTEFCRSKVCIDEICMGGVRLALKAISLLLNRLLTTFFFWLASTRTDDHAILV